VLLVLLLLLLPVLLPLLPLLPLLVVLRYPLSLASPPPTCSTAMPYVLPRMFCVSW
jgi:hypothetical protein